MKIFLSSLENGANCPDGTLLAHYCERERLLQFKKMLI